MSQYFYGICHDCKVIAEISNVSVPEAEIHVRIWAHDRGHEFHNYEWISEYDERYENHEFHHYQEQNDWW
jgi:hypothetical protein